MTLTQLEHVLQAYKAGSFSRAARACGITQAALSNSIAKLEEELGERIFSRTTRHLCLSPLGEKLLPNIEQILGVRDAILETAKAQQEPTTMVIGHSPLIPTQVLTMILGAIREVKFGSAVRLIEENLSDLLRRLGEHTVDIALLPEAEYASAFRSAPVWEEPLYYVPRQSIRTLGVYVELENLTKDTFVMVPDQCGLARITRALFSSAGVSLRTYAGEAMGYHVLQEWAALDLGSAILPQSRLTEGARAIPLLRRPDEPAVLTYRVVWHGEYARGKQLAALLEPYRPIPRPSGVSGQPKATSLT
jgi:LysR family hydrogen peroxide-inducible transcriptional activator